MATKAKLIQLPARPTAEPEIVHDRGLVDGLKRHRRFDGRGFWRADPEPGRPFLKAQDVRLRDALRRWRETPPDLADARAVGEALASVFPGSRVSVGGYGQGLAAIAEDDALTADIVRAVARRVRAESRTLPPLADLRDQMTAERDARARLLNDLDDYEAAYAAAVERDREAAVPIIAGAAKAGIVLSIDDVIDAWAGMDSVGCWFHERERNPKRRNTDYLAEWIFAAIERATPQARQAAELVQAIAPYERDHMAAWDSRGLDDATQAEREAFRVEMPEARTRFAAECDALAAALGLLPIE